MGKQSKAMKTQLKKAIAKVKAAKKNKKPKVHKKKVTKTNSKDDARLKVCNAMLKTGAAKLAALKKKEAAAHKLYIAQRKARNRAFLKTHKTENNLEEQID